MPKIFAVILATLLPAAAVADAQEPLPLLSSEVELGDFGISDFDAVVRGRISIVHAGDGPRLAVYFLRGVSAPTPTPTPTPLQPVAGGSPLGRRAPVAPPELLRALWVWNTEELLADATERAVFMDFVEAQGISRVFLHLPAAEGQRPIAGFIPFDGAALGPLIAELRRLGALTYGLDGDPYYARPENHQGVLRTVRRVVEHNRSRPPEQRFHGVRYDVEPYLLKGFQGPGRQRILDDYVRLIADISEVARDGDLAVGVDIPFWFDSPDEETGERFEAVLDGERRLVLDHVMSRVDDVGIMAYRTRADGPDGVLTQSSGELSLSRDTGAGVFVGVETTQLFDEHLYTFRGPARAGLPTLMDAPWIVLEDLGEGRVRVWYAEGEQALKGLAGFTSGSSSLKYWFAGNPSAVPGDRLSFYSLGLGPMQSVTAEVLRQMGGRDGFLGLAYHDYRGLKALIEGS